MGVMLAEPGFHTRAFVEWEGYPRSVLIAAQRAGYFAPAPIWDDLRSFDARPFRGAFDTILAGYPCQPFSAAGQRKGVDDERHLWPDVARIIREVGPEWVFLENVAGHVSLGAETVLRELWGMGYTPAAGLFSAAEVGAPHERLRIFIVSHRTGADGEWHGRRDNNGRHDRGHTGSAGQHSLADAKRDAGHQGRCRSGVDPASGGTWQADRLGASQPSIFPPGPGDADAWRDTLATSPDLAPATGIADCLSWAGHMAAALECAEQAEAQSRLRRMAHGLASRSRALRLLGNGVCPLAAAYAWRSLATAHGLGPVDMATADDHPADDAN